MMLSVVPGLASLAYSTEWAMLTMIPGLVASGASLLFGVNAFCLDGRGLLWRETMPVEPRLTFDARAWVMVEVLAVAAGSTLVLGALRSGVPTASQLAAVLSVFVLVVLQVTATSLWWSVRRPFAADLGHARATPAPPLVMVGYSGRLALTTTLTGMVFGTLGASVPWPWVLVAAVPLALWSLGRLFLARRTWIDGHKRALIAVTVAA